MSEQTKSKVVILAEAFRAARKAVDEAEEVVKLAKAERDQIEAELREQLEADGVQSVKVEGVGTVYLEAKSYARIAEGKLEDAVKWLDEHGEGAIAKRTVPHQTLSAWYNERTENDKPLPPEDLIAVFRETKVRLRTK